MNRVVPAVLLAAVLSAAGNAAADPVAYRARASATFSGTRAGITYAGGCAFETSYDAARGEWSGPISLWVSATRPSGPESIWGARCTLYVNGVSKGTVLTAPDSLGATSNASTVRYDASPTDVVTLRVDAVVGGFPFSASDNADVTGLPPVG